MQVDPEITAAIALLAPYLPEVAKGAAKTIGEESGKAAARLLGWLRTRLTGRSKAALDDLEAEPGSEINQHVLRLRMADLAAQEPGFLEELRKLAPAGVMQTVTQAQTVGAGGTGVQNAGQGNTIFIGR